MINEYNQKLWRECSNYVKETCKNRDPSHGYKHMKEVAITSLDIYRNITNNYSDTLITKIILSSWLHDVNDHKYKDNHLDSMRNFISNYQDADCILNIIDKISFSKEVKCPNFLETLNEEDLLVRNIVSDADKLKAIGDIGLIRCIQFILERVENISLNDLYDQVYEHCKEKLFKLWKYMRIPFIIELAEEITLDMNYNVLCLENFRLFYEKNFKNQHPLLN